ncbi:MAG: YraN family protein [bacterium]
MDEFKATTREKGYLGEDLAIQYLSDIGYTIIQKNFVFGKTGEIDIIAREGKTLCFIEVKARANEAYGSVYETVPAWKQKKIRRTAEGYLYVNKISNVECRFDFIGIDYSFKPPMVDLIKDAF